MQFTIPAATLLAFVSGALAQVAGFDTITKPVTDEVVDAGSTYTIVWEAAPAKYADETVVISLIAGKDQGHLVPLDDPVATGVLNSEGSYAWKVASDLGDAATYGIKIALESDPEMFQYSFPFHIKASDDVPTNTTVPVTSTASDDDASSTVAPPKPTGHSNQTTSADPKPTVTTTSTKGGDAEPTADTPEESAPPTVGDSGAATNGAMGTFALVGVLAIAAFNL